MLLGKHIYSCVLCTDKIFVVIFMNQNIIIVDELRFFRSVADFEKSIARGHELTKAQEFTSDASTARSVRYH